MTIQLRRPRRVRRLRGRPDGSKPAARRSGTRRLVGVASLLVLLPLVAACGFDAQTDQVYQAANGTNDRSQSVYVLNSVIVTDKNGQGTWAGSLVNTDQAKSNVLVGVSGWSGGGGPIVIRPDGLVNLGRTGQVTVKDQKIKPGAFVPLTFEFANGQTTKLLTPVLPWSATGEYSAVPLPQQSPKASASKQ